MKIKNFKYKNIGIYIKNIIFVFFKNINQDVSERNVKKINKIMRSVNKSNIASKLKKINDLFKKHLDALNTTKYEFPLKAMANFSTSFLKKSNQQSNI